MKQIGTLLIFFLIFSCKKAESSPVSQTKVYEGNKYVVFDLKHYKDAKTVDGIDWGAEKLSSEFTLKGKNDIRYSIHIKNDSIAELSRYEGKKWIFQETIEFSEWAVSRIDNLQVISEFQITDFDKDGNEDLICWVATNINSNQWTLIYLNDPNRKRLKKLHNNADDKDIWDAPVYDNKKKVITSELVSGAYGFAATYTHKLINQIAIPLEKEESDNTQVNAETGEGAVIKNFVGENGKWKLVSRTEE